MDTGVGVFWVHLIRRPVVRMCFILMIDVISWKFHSPTENQGSGDNKKLKNRAIIVFFLIF